MNKRQIEIVVEETVKYSRTAVIETELSDYALGDVFDEAEKGYHPDDVISSLKKAGATVKEPFDDDYSSPVDSELEITEYSETK